MWERETQTKIKEFKLTYLIGLANFIKMMIMMIMMMTIMMIRLE